jgi:nitrite reductase (NADH) large subunit
MRSFDELPATAPICNCNGVTKAAIGACVADGKRSLEAVIKATYAGTGCGSCRPRLAEAIAWFCGGEAAKSSTSCPGGTD